MIKGIKFASIPVTDQDRALEFYTKKLGFRVLTDARSTANNAGSSSASRAPKRKWCCSRQTNTKR